MLSGGVLGIGMLAYSTGRLRLPEVPSLLVGISTPAR